MTVHAQEIAYNRAAELLVNKLMESIEVFNNLYSPLDSFIKLEKY